MKIVGIDLAAKEKNPTGLALVEDKRVECITVYTDSQIFSQIFSFNPSVIAIDAPLTLDENRYADRYLRKYGAMSLKIPSIKLLAERGLRIKNEIENCGFKVIEVFPTATAKILGFYRKNKIEMLNYFKDFEMTGCRNKHEVDAIIAAYTALLYTQGECVEMEGVVFPREF